MLRQLRLSVARACYACSARVSWAGSRQIPSRRYSSSKPSRESTVLRAGQVASLVRVLYSPDPTCPPPLLAESTAKAFRPWPVLSSPRARPNRSRAAIELRDVGPLLVGFITPT